MPTPDDAVAVYQELSECYERRGEAPMRDRFLVLAADAALRAGQTEEADRIRLRLLKVNPHHMLKPYATFTQAMQAPDVQTYLRDLRLNYPPEVAAVLLRSLRTASVPNAQPVAQSESSDQLKVFPKPHEFDIGETAALPADFLELPRRAAPVPAKPLRQPLPAQATPRPQPALPAKKPALIPLRPDPILPARATTPPLAEETTTPGGGWFALCLFVLVVIVGLLWLGFLATRLL